MRGTPLVPAVAKAAAGGGDLAVARERAARRRDWVTDEQGRRRFHGAFTGGWSAGYYNTVGSAEGWAPTIDPFARGGGSSGAGGGGAEWRAPAFYMDEEDRADFVQRGLAKRADYSDSLGLAAAARGVAVARHASAGDDESASADEWFAGFRAHPVGSGGRPAPMPVPVRADGPVGLLRELVVAVGEGGVGRQLLLALGWREGLPLGRYRSSTAPTAAFETLEALWADAAAFEGNTRGLGYRGDAVAGSAPGLAGAKRHRDALLAAAAGEAVHAALLHDGVAAGPTAGGTAKRRRLMMAAGAAPDRHAYTGHAATLTGTNLLGNVGDDGDADDDDAAIYRSVDITDSDLGDAPAQVHAHARLPRLTGTEPGRGSSGASGRHRLLLVDAPAVAALEDAPSHTSSDAGSLPGFHRVTPAAADVRSGGEHVDAMARFPVPLPPRGWAGWHIPDAEELAPQLLLLLRQQQARYTLPPPPPPAPAPLPRAPVPATAAPPVPSPAPASSPASDFFATKFQVAGAAGAEPSVPAPAPAMPARPRRTIATWLPHRILCRRFNVPDPFDAATRAELEAAAGMSGDSGGAASRAVAAQAGWHGRFEAGPVVAGAAIGDVSASSGGAAAAPVSVEELRREAAALLQSATLGPLAAAVLQRGVCASDPQPPLAAAAPQPEVGAAASASAPPPPPPPPPSSLFAAIFADDDDGESWAA